eukprot:4271516-Pleurochrysis_carterae.AAC.1
MMRRLWRSAEGARRGAEAIRRLWCSVEGARRCIGNTEARRCVGKVRRLERPSDGAYRQAYSRWGSRCWR